MWPITLRRCLRSSSAQFLTYILKMSPWLRLVWAVDISLRSPSLKRGDVAVSSLANLSFNDSKDVSRASFFLAAFYASTSLTSSYVRGGLIPCSLNLSFWALIAACSSSFFFAIYSSSRCLLYSFLNFLRSLTTVRSRAIDSLILTRSL